MFELGLLYIDGIEKEEFFVLYIAWFISLNNTYGADSCFKNMFDRELLRNPLWVGYGLRTEFKVIKYELNC